MPGNFLYVLSRSTATITEFDVSGATPTMERPLPHVFLLGQISAADTMPCGMPVANPNVSAGNTSTVVDPQTAAGVERKPRSLRLLLSLLASTVFALAGLLAIRWLVSAAWLHANNEVAGNYLQTLGTIYAVLLAFVVFVVWQQHNDTRSAVEEEANELSDLSRTIHALDGTDAVKEQLQNYCRLVIGEEWRAMSTGRPSENADQALDQIWAALLNVRPQNSREEVIYSEALARFNDLSDARRERLYCSRLRLPPSLWGLLLTNGALVVGSMWIFGLDSFTAHALMTIALAGSIAFILVLIADLDNPFWGSWRISPEAFKRALRH